MDFCTVSRSVGAGRSRRRGGAGVGAGQPGLGTLPSPPPAAPHRVPLHLTVPVRPQAAVAQQDTLMEARFPEGPERREKLTRANSRDGELGRSGPAPAAPDKQATELALLQRQHALLQEELRRCRRLGEERATEAGSLEARLRESEQARALLEREAEEARRQLAALGHSEPPPAEAPWARRPLDPRRRSLPAGDALYLSFTPPQVRRP